MMEWQSLITLASVVSLFTAHMSMSMLVTVNEILNVK